MTRGRLVVVALAVAMVAAGIVAVVVGSSGSSSQVALPGSMASVGDSITRAFDLDRRHLLQDSPEDSWSTGTDAAVGSHYDRILAVNPAIADHVYNDAQTGAVMAALEAQLEMASAQRVDYVTVLMGANDLCTASPATMTPTATFAAQFTRSLSGFFAADPGAHVFVSSIPDIFRLWDNLHANTVAQLAWTVAHVCQSMLSVTATAADRQLVVTQEQADNAALASVCRLFDRCRFDDGATYRVGFTAAEVSTGDYFHPSLAGQRALAAVTWAQGYWPSKR